MFSGRRRKKTGKQGKTWKNRTTGEQQKGGGIDRKQYKRDRLHVKHCWAVQNHRMVGVGRDLCGSPSPTPLPKQGHLQQAAQDLAQAGKVRLSDHALCLVTEVGPVFLLNLFLTTVGGGLGDQPL